LQTVGNLSLPLIDHIQKGLEGETIEDVGYHAKIQSLRDEQRPLYVEIFQNIAQNVPSRRRLTEEHWPKNATDEC
jgi:hypothetical protein